MNVLEYLQPAVEAVKQRETAADEAQAERERLIQAGRDMAALLLEREVPIERELHRAVPVTITKQRLFLPNSTKTIYRRELGGAGWDLFSKDKPVRRQVQSLYDDGVMYEDTTVTDFTTLLTDGNFTRHNTFDGARPIDLMTDEQPSSIKEGLARLAMRYDLVE